MSLYFALLTVEINNNKKSVKFQRDILFFYFIQDFKAENCSWEKKCHEITVIIVDIVIQDDQGKLKGHSADFT